MSSRLLDVQDLVAGYGRTPVLQSVDIHLDDREAVGILGINGAGKSTLLRALSGDIETARGTVVLDGKPITRARTWTRVRHGLVHVPEGRHIFGPLTVEENLELARLHARPSGQSALDVFELFPRLHERRSQRAGSMSGGEQQMLALARGLLLQPRLLMIDEMSAGLSPVLATELADALREIHAAGVAVLVVEQSPHLIARIVDRVYLLQKGAVVASGTLDSLGGESGIASRYLGLATVT